MFNKKGFITVNTANANEDELFEIALSAGADDMQNTGSVFEITCELGAYEKLIKALKDKGIATEVAEISMVPRSTIPISDEKTAMRVISLMEALEDHDDVQNAYSNFDIPNEIMERIS
jgi:transcriptional/translational regulatory protein YebC/TACO1